MARYFIVAGIAFIFDFSTLYFLTKFDFFKTYYLIAVAISFIIGVTINYTLSIIWVFHKKRLKNRSAEFLIFAVIGIVGLFLNMLLVWLFTEYFFQKFFIIQDKQLRILASRFISIFISYIWNFLSRKFILFS